MLLRERRDPDAEVAAAGHQADQVGGVLQALRVLAASRACGSPGGSPRSARTLRTPASAYCPMMWRSSATEWSTAVRWRQRGQRGVGGDPLGHRDGAVAGASRRRRRSPTRSRDAATRARGSPARAAARPRRSSAGKNSKENSRAPVASSSRIVRPGHADRLSALRDRGSRAPGASPYRRRMSSLPRARSTATTCARASRRPRRASSRASCRRWTRSARTSARSPTRWSDLVAGGKRLRPAFCYWGYRGAGGGGQRRDRRGRRRAGAVPGLRAHPRRRDGRQRHPAGPAGGAPPVRRAAPQPRPGRRPGGLRRRRGDPARRPVPGLVRRDARDQRLRRRAAAAGATGSTPRCAPS